MSTPTLTRHIGLGHGIALYVSAILGAGVLVLPGQVASMAGPASLVSWALAGLLGMPLAAMFALLARRFPDAGGIASYVGAAFGPLAGGVTGWLFFVAGSVGQTIVPLTGGYYVAHALGRGNGTALLVAAVILVIATATNLAGVRVGAATQLALAIAVGTALLATVLIGIPRMDPGRLRPFAPHGLAPVGAAVVVLFFAFAGWEAIAHLAGEFRDPERDIPLAVGSTVVVVTALYLGTACAVVMTGTYGSPAVDRVAVELLLQQGVGAYAAPLAAAMALVISLGTTNAFIAGVSRLASSLAADGWLPAASARISRSGVPIGGVLTVAGVAAAGLLVAAWGGWGTESLVVVPSTLVVAVYVMASAAATRLLTGWGRASGVATLSISLLLVPTAAVHALIPLLCLALALLSRRLCAGHQRRSPTPPSPLTSP